jgi:predicted Zn-dependent peptidase
MRFEEMKNNLLNETIYKGVHKSGLTVVVHKKPEFDKFYSVISTKYGSNHVCFKDGDMEDFKEVADGIAHFLEHKMFEQESGVNSLDTLSSIGVDANAYTTNDHTAYLYDCTDNFYEALDEFMDYVQNPYYTDDNVEKERGIIEQEIRMYEDYPEWDLYMNTMKLMYEKCPVNVDIAGTKESIAQIDKEKLYLIYNNFYTPENMAIVFVGDIEEKEIYFSGCKEAYFFFKKIEILK